MNLQTVAKRCRHGALAGAIAMALALPTGGAASAATLSLYEAKLNLDGTVGAMDTTGLTPGWLGSITTTISGVGAHRVIGYFDYEIDELINTFFNEYGAAIDAPSSGQSWEIDEPGFVSGNIYANFLGGALDNSNGVPETAPNDVSMAMGWDFLLLSGQEAIVKFIVDDGIPTSGFYLAQTDPDSHASIYLRSTLDIHAQGQDPNVPEPASLALLGLGLAALAAARRNKAIA